MTTEELGEAIGCTKAAISLYENEEREPSSDICKKIAKVLGVTWIDLLSISSDKLVFNHVSFRKKQKATKKDIELLKADIESHCSDRVSLINIVGKINFNIFKPRKLSFKDSTFENAKKIRSFLGLPSTGPIYSIANILEHAGIIVLSLECAEEIDGINGMVNDIPYIFFNSKNRTIERQRFTLIHEACHLFFNDSEDEKGEKEIEKYINIVTGNVLIPNSDIYSLFGKTNRKISVYLRNDVARQYKITPSCLLTRLLEAGVITENYHRNYFIYLNKNGGRKSEKTLLDLVKDNEIPSIFNQQVYLALSEELITASKAAEFLHIPLYDVMQNMRIE